MGFEVPPCYARGMRRVLGWMLVVTGCGPNVPTDDTNGASDDDASADGGSDESSGPDATASVTMTSADASGDPTVATTTATTSTPTGCDTEFVSACQAYCATVITCDPDSQVYEECVLGCTTELGTVGGDCGLAMCEAFACHGTQTCEELDAGTEECNALDQIADRACGDVVDECFFGSNGAGSCEYGCAGPPETRMLCDGSKCTCFVDGSEVGGCPDEVNCNDTDAIVDYALACCGF